MKQKRILIILLQFIAMGASYAQVFLCGRIVDEKYNPMAGVSVQLNPTYATAVTDRNGLFGFQKIVKGNYEIMAYALGFEKTITTIHLQKSDTIQIVLHRLTYMSNEITVHALREGSNKMMSTSNLDAAELKNKNTGVDIPMLLEQLPSVVSTSDAGTGIGYTGIRIRGTDATRINVTLNGVPLNDAESQQLYWVDLPDLASSLGSVQVQRGVGTSTNGGSAFGGAINLLLQKESGDPYVTIQTGGGSFATLKRNISFGTGMLQDHFFFSGRLSKITSDGYVDRASANLQSYMLQGGYNGKNFSLSALMLSGKEKTYQAWNGIPESRLKNDVAGMLAYISRNELDSAEGYNLLNSGRTYNYFEYKNQTDNYEQTHYQVHLLSNLNTRNTLQVALHYTQGAGYYEEFKKNEQLSDYQITNTIYLGDTITHSDLVRQKWLDNDFYGFTFSLNSQWHHAFELINGGGFNTYDGRHYGHVIWYKFMKAGMDPWRYYADDAKKNDFHYFVKGIYSYKKWQALLDIQYHGVQYFFEGKNELLQTGQQNAKLNFVNPKVGISYARNNYESAYTSVSVANKEPSRDDYVNSSRLSRPLPERLVDIESGYTISRNNWNAKATYFYMVYKNQLALSGKINDVGEYNRVNIDDSYRQGLEAELAYKPIEPLTLNANFTLSRNKIKRFENYTDNYDSGVQEFKLYENTDISYSPSKIAYAAAVFRLCKAMQLFYEIKYVGRQYLDNTSSGGSLIPEYTVSNSGIIIGHDFAKAGSIELNFRISNLWNALYTSNGYTYGYIAGGEHVTENFYFPQAGRHFVMQFTWRINQAIKK